MAIDVALTAHRKGAEDVTLVCLEKREEMPAWEYEIDEALEEGVTIVNSLGPKRFLEKEREVAGSNSSGAPRSSMKRALSIPSYDENDLDPDGNRGPSLWPSARPETSPLPSEKVVPSQREEAWMPTLSRLQTPLGWVFAGGDAFTGPSPWWRPWPAERRRQRAFIATSTAVDLTVGTDPGLVL